MSTSAETLQVRMLSAVAGAERALQVGDVVTLPADVARAWIADRLAEPVPPAIETADARGRKR